MTLLNQLQARAAAGDADAQYQLALALIAQGRHRRALRWLRHAATAGHREAVQALALHLLDPTGGDFDPGTAKALLTRVRAEAQYANSLLSMISLQGGEGISDWPAAAKIVRQGAHHGQAMAQRQLGMLLQLYDDRRMARLGRQLMALAAEQGESLAQLLMVRLGNMVRDNRGGERLRAWLEAALDRGHPLAHIIADSPLLSDRPSARDFEAPQPLTQKDWGWIIATTENRPKPDAIAQGNGERIHLLPLLCDYLIGLAHAAMGQRNQLALTIGYQDILTGLVEQRLAGVQMLGSAAMTIFRQRPDTPATQPVDGPYLWVLLGARYNKDAMIGQSDQPDQSTGRATLSNDQSVGAPAPWTAAGAGDQWLLGCALAN